MSRKLHAILNDPWHAPGQQVPGFATARINETATRARAGLLNLLSATTIVLLVFKPDLDPVLYVGPFVILDMFSAAAFGLTPLSPTGVLGTVLTPGPAADVEAHSAEAVRVDPRRNAWRHLLVDAAPACPDDVDHRGGRDLLRADLARGGSRVLRRLLDVWSPSSV